MVLATLVALALAAGTEMTTAMPAGAAIASSVPPSCPAARPGSVTCFALFRAEPTPAGTSARHTGSAATGATSPTSGYGPADLVSAYRIPPTQTTATVAIVEAYDNPNLAADMGVYRQTFGLQPCADGCLQVVDEHGGSSLPTEQQAAWGAESDLSVQMVSAVCPSCHITVVEANTAHTADIYTAVQTAADLAQYVVMSWGAPEWARARFYTRTYFSKRQVAFVASSGDYGYGTANYPAASPNVLAVGGTTLTPSSNARGWDETVWNTGDGSSSASGCSEYTPTPAWQAQAVDGVCGHRSVVDVSVVGDPDPGVAVYTDPAPGTDAGPQWALAGGTSVGAPIVAAMYAIAGTPNDYNYPSAYPYYHAGDLTDITTGNNLFLENGCEPIAQCTAGPGYDGPSGLGSPIGVGAFAAVPPSPVTMTPPPDVVGYVGDAATVTLSASTDDPLARIRYRVTGLPPGMQLGARGVITGTPTTTGTYPVSVTAVSSGGPTAQAAFTWQVGTHSVATVATPRITGMPLSGDTLKAQTYQWRQDTVDGWPINPKVSYQWLANRHPIPNATRARFTVPERKVWLGRRLEVRVTARLPDYRTYVCITAPTAGIARAA